MLIAVTFRVYIVYLKDAAKLNAEIWDLKMCTSGDFTVSIELPGYIWEDWQKKQESD